MKTLSLALTVISLTFQILAVPVNITRFDGQSGNGVVGPWAGTSGLGSAFEDNETEPRTMTGDEWDLEALVYNPTGNRLSVIGTFDFAHGVILPNDPITYGAIFVKPLAGSSWTRAYVLDFTGNTYSLYDNFTTIAPTEILASGPYTINTATAHLLGTGNFDYTTGVVDPYGLGLQRESGTGHNEIDLDLALLGAGILNGFDVHTTMTCGNDTLEGQFINQTTSVPDGGSTALLLGCGVGALGLIRVRSRAV